MGASLGLLALPGLGVALMSMGILFIGAGLCVLGAILVFSLFSKEIRNIRLMISMNGDFRNLTTELQAALLLMGISVGLPIVVYSYLGSPSEIAALKAQVDELSRLKWMPLSADEIVAIKHSAAGTQPIEPTMTIQYLGSNAYDLAVSFERLFSEIGFKPKILLDNHLSFVEVIKIEPDGRDADLLNKIVNSIETVTKDRVKCEFTNSKGQGSTRIFIGQKVG
jgi:hypothetical protein